MQQSVYWFMFVLGLVSFGGLAITANSLIKATPNSIRELRNQISGFNVDFQNKKDRDHRFQREAMLALSDITRDAISDEEFRKEAIELLERIDSELSKLKYQHDHADSFGFGTGETNAKIAKIYDMLLKMSIRLKTK